MAKILSLVAAANQMNDGSGSVANGDAVTTWIDTASGYSATPPGGSTRRNAWTQSVAALNNRPAVLIRDATTASNGTVPVLEIPATLLNSLSGSYSFAWVINLDNLAAGSYNIIASNTDGGTGKHFYVRFSGTLQRYNGFNTGVTFPRNTSYIVVYTYDSATTTEKYYISSATAAASATNNLGAAVNAIMRIGCGLATGGQGLAGYMAEMHCYNHVLSQSEIIALLSDRGGYYGITVNLSGGTLTGGTARVTALGTTSATITTGGVGGGSGTYTYQWQSSPVGAGSWANVSGATTATVTVTGTSGTKLDYRCRVNDGTTTADSTTVSVPFKGATAKTFCFLGDSITDLDPGTGDPSYWFDYYISLRSQALNATIINTAVSGLKLQQIAANITSTIASNPADFYSLMAGTNDFAAGRTLAQLQGDFGTVAAAVATAGKKLVANQLTWRSDSPAGIQALITSYNAWLSAGAGGLVGNGTVHLGDETVYAAYQGTGNFPDNLHPNSAMAETLGDLWAEGFPASLLPASTTASNYTIFGEEDDNMAKAIYDLVPITPSDSTLIKDLVNDQGGIVILGTAGDLVIDTLGGETRTIPVATNTEINIPVTRVKAATTATGIFIKECQFPG